ncbi:UDP-2,4-diacetamido-2,4,6-trideoxy-beta-L-altropyranose hydrolase [Paenibacillus sp. 1_12]|uniref:UDP-2,4-diacetamido-2,4, 6-trideoxy-beta-L-altropyranose hydrolase n=1 Tax=Paenibacillus sp. 1_12 TaxID=1566278 RepID=UPI0008E5C486|nr:UDP-2,4-diacetamido-2,4,6-trideoxy-beta-L-altropyranose hydrolase [Paenibacillus sp. 1_12]SFL89580.1 UDP-2,4-diacetamido-2,4,6-trideoxy-beta-L-altropyranose hydrolase [Paenibacillus sp. 1_12]
MDVLFRLDSSLLIGTGHAVRCLTLAEEFRSRGFSVGFICRDLSGNYNKIIQKLGYELFTLPNYQMSPISEGLMDTVNEEINFMWTEFGPNFNFKFLVVDHYSLDSQWEKAMSQFTEKIVVIDDLANRNHHCDYLIDQNNYLNGYNRYDGIVSESCTRMLGPQYALLRKEFRTKKSEVRTKDGSIKRVMICFGGTDPTNETSKVLNNINLFDEDLFFDVIIGENNPNKYNIRLLCANISNCRLHIQTTKIADLMIKADLAICSGGTMTWERYCLGLPAVIIAVADNQVEIAKTSAMLNIDVYLGESKDVEGYQVWEAVERLLSQKEVVLSASVKASSLVDGLGVTYVVNNLLDKVQT